MDPDNPFLDADIRQELRDFVQPLLGAVHGSRHMATACVPSDVIELLDLVEWLQNEVNGLRSNQHSEVQDYHDVYQCDHMRLVTRDTSDDPWMHIGRSGVLGSECTTSVYLVNAACFGAHNVHSRVSR